MSLTESTPSPYSPQPVSSNNTEQDLDLWFSVPYDAGDGRMARVRVGVGYGSALPWHDYQTVEIDDPRAPFTIRGEVNEGRIAHVHLTRRQDGTIRQADIRALPIVSMIQQWATVGREYQKITEAHFVAIADEGDIAAAERESRRYVDRLDNLWGGSSYQEAVRRSRDALRGGARRDVKRARGADAEVLLQRVVDEYRDAVGRHDPSPVASVARRLNYHRTHVSRLLRQARARGDLPPANRKEGGR